MRSQRPVSSGMSCSITRIDAPGDVLHPLEQRAERLGLLLGDAAGRLVEHDHRGVRREQAGQLHDAADAGGQLAGELLAERVEPHEVDEEVDRLVDVGLALLGDGLAEGGGDHALAEQVALAGHGERLRGGERREEPGLLERAAEAPSLAGAAAGR